MMEAFNPFSLKDKTILVTGASSGIGRGIAIVTSKMGALVVANGRDNNRLHETLLMMSGQGHIAAVGDLTNFASIVEMVSSLPQLDGIVHCAGVGQRIPCKNLYLDEVNQVMDVNFKAPVMLQAELIRQKKIKKGSSIVFISSIAAWSPSVGNSVYSASKGAIVSYANCLALELAPRNVRVNCISPGMVWTDLIRNGEVDEEQLKADEANYPLKRYGKPEDIANLAIYMLSDASSWMTGSNVKLAGGI